MTLPATYTLDTCKRPDSSSSYGTLADGFIYQAIELHSHAITYLRNLVQNMREHGATMSGIQSVGSPRLV
jgi:hypothetical protein